MIVGRRRRRRAAAVLAVAVTALAGCGSERAPEPAQPQPVRIDVTVDAMMGHLRKLQDIADANGGNRALGTPGYAASVDYVAGLLRDKGFDVSTDEFDVRQPWADEPTLTVGGAPVKAVPLNYTIGTPPDGVDGPLVAARVDDTPGCSPTDYDGLPVRGAVVLVDRGACAFGIKQQIAADRGAVAMVVVNNVDDDGPIGATLGESTKVTIPVVGITKAEGARLRANPGATTLKLNAGVREDKTRNVIAQTKTGDTANVVMAGAHLDSVPEGPGINDNGSGVAAVLETALRLGSSPDVRNAVRFGFWGAEEVGLVGSDEYVRTLDVDALKDIALYLNFDMLASPNPGYFTYDGDQSTLPRGGVPRVPEGSAGIERTLVKYLDDAGKPARDTDFDGRSDYDAFTKAGIPVGGLFSGAEGKMTDEQAKLWGGTAGAEYDPNYHKATDDIDNVDRTALDLQGRGVAHAVGLYAQNLGGRNGVPVRDDRVRHVVEAQ